MLDGVISIGIGRSAAPLLLFTFVLTSSADARERTPSAFDFMVEAVLALCLADSDRIETARRLVPESWRLTDSEDRLDVDGGNEALFGRHDAHARGWRGTLSNGRGSLSVSVTEHRDLARPHEFTARFSISPEGSVDLARFQRRIGMSLRPRGPAIEGRGPPRPGEENIIAGWQPSERQFGQTQSYSLEPSPAGIRITAERYWGAGYPVQRLSVSCATVERDE